MVFVSRARELVCPAPDTSGRGTPDPLAVHLRLADRLLRKAASRREYERPRTQRYRRHAAATGRAWEHLTRIAQELFARYGYEPIYTPLFEHTEVFTRGIGEATDVVSKEMYTFEDKGGRSITLASREPPRASFGRRSSTA